MPEPSLGREPRLRHLAVVLAVAALAEVLGIVLISAMGDAGFQVGLDLTTVGFLGSVIAFPLVGALIVQRRPRTRVAWLMILLGTGLGVGLLAYGYGVIGLRSRALPAADWVLIASQLFFVPPVGTGAALLLLLFPTDRFAGPRWRYAAVLAGLGAVLFEIGTLFHPAALHQASLPDVPNPIGAPAGMADFLDALATAGNVCVAAAILVAAGSLVARYRRAGPIEAAQIRWIALVGLLAAVSLAISAFQAGQLSDLAFGIGLVLLACLPIAIGVAITRYRLYEIDRLINRALVYGSLTAILAGVFTAAIGLGQRVFVAITGQKSDAAIVATTLVVATLYSPLRKGVESVIDRRFKYEHRLFGAYQDELDRTLAIVNPARAATRLATAVVVELRATGAAVLDHDGRVLGAAGSWPTEPVVRVPIESTAGPFAEVVVGPRSDRSGYDAATTGRLAVVAGLAALALGGGSEPVRRR